MSPESSAGPATTVHGAFAESAAIWPSHDFFHVPLAAAQGYSAAAINSTYDAAARRFAGLGIAYGACGLRSGQRVALLLDNRAEFFLNYLALDALGVSVVPFNGEATPSELAHILRDSQAVLALAWSERRSALERALVKLESCAGASLGRRGRAEAAAGRRARVSGCRRSGSPLPRAAPATPRTA